MYDSSMALQDILLPFHMELCAFLEAGSKLSCISAQRSDHLLQDYIDNPSVATLGT